MKVSFAAGAAREVVRWKRKWYQTRQKLTLDLLAECQVEVLQRCGPPNLAEVTYGG